MRWLAFIVLGLVGAFGAWMLMPVPSLDEFQTSIEKKYPLVQHISLETLRINIAETPQATLLFDVREVKEYKVSHLSGAIQIDPGMKQKEFMQIYGDKIGGKDIVFYCSVGRRASTMVSRVQEGILAGGGEHVANLRGGIFAWHNESRALANENGATDLIHPYVKKMGKLITHPEKIAFHLTANE